MLYLSAALLLSLAALTVNGSPMPEARAGSHQVTFVNNCGSGNPVFLYQDDASFQGSKTVYGPLRGGVAWLSDFADCQSSGVNCGTVEFSLLNPGDDAANTQNSINYSLQAQGNHQFKYGMNFQYTGGCSGGPPGPCTSAENCPGAFTGYDTTGGTVVNCVGYDAGVTITFC